MKTSIIKAVGGLLIVLFEIALFAYLDKSTYLKALIYTKESALEITKQHYHIILKFKEIITCRDSTISIRFILMGWN